MRIISLWLDLFLFRLRIKASTLEIKVHAIRRFLAESFAFHIRNHLRSNFRIISGEGIICSAMQGATKLAVLCREPKL